MSPPGLTLVASPLLALGAAVTPPNCAAGNGAHRLEEPVTDTAALAAWLRQQLDDDERRARRAGEQRIVLVPHYAETSPAVHLGESVPLPDVVEMSGLDDGEPIATFHSAAHADHFARHDPARVLRRIAAYRTLIDDALRAAASGVYEAELLAENVLLGLAAEFADRPGYAEVIKP